MKKNLVVLSLIVSIFVVGSVMATDVLFEDEFSASHPLDGDWYGTYPETPSSTDLYDDIYTNDYSSYECDEPDCGGYYLATKDNAAATIAIDTTEYENIELSYYRRDAGTECLDRLKVQWKIGSGIFDSWQEIENVLNPISSWSQNTFSFPTSADGQDLIQIRFWMDDGNLDYALWDNVLVTGEDEDPTVEICEECCSEGVEATSPLQEKTKIEINAEDNSEIVSCEIDWGDETITDCIGDYEEAEYTHQYGDGGDFKYTVTVTVEDGLGNQASDHIKVEVENVDPWNVNIDGPTESVIGQPTTFTTDAEDVEIDEEAGLKYTWTFDGTDEIVTEDPKVSYTWESDSKHTVDLCVEDKDGGEGCAKEPHEIDIVEPTELDAQEVAAYYDLDADFGENAGDSDNSFDTGVEPTSDITCTIIVGPDNLKVSGSDDDCVVQWNSPRPVNDEQGEHLVIIKADNGVNDPEYYSFTVTVWSWIIDLKKGWNLISIPYVPEDEDIDEVILDQLDDVLPGGKEYVVYSYQFDGEDSKWLKSKKNKAGDLDTVNPGYSYWIKVKEDAKLRGNGRQLRYTSPGMPPEIEVPTNSWAMIGRYGIIGKDVGSCLNPHAGSIPKRKALESLTKLDNELHVFDIDENEHLDEIRSLSNNEGYWLWVEDEAFNNANSESYAPLDRFYREDLMCL